MTEDSSADHGLADVNHDLGASAPVRWASRRRVVFGALSLVVLWLGWSTWTLYRAGTHAATGRDILLELGTIDPLAADLDEVADQIDLAESELRIADRHLAKVAIRPLGVLPVIGRQLESGNALVDASLELTGALRPIFAEVNEVQAGGAQELDRMQFLDTMGVLLAELRSTMDTIDFGPDHHLLASLADSRQDGVVALEELAVLADQAAVGVTGLESLLADGEFLLIVGSPSETQAASGMPLSVGTLATHDGDLQLLTINASENLFPISGSQVIDPDIAARWGFLKPGNDFRKLPLTPRFEDYVGPEALTMWEASAGEQLRGTFYIDPIALEAVLRVVGDIEVEGERFGADNVVDYLLSDQYSTFSDADDDERLERRDRLAGIAGAAFEALGTRPWDPVLLLRELVSAADAGHIKAYSTVASEQALWRQVGVAGEIDGDEMLVGLMNLGGNKLDPYLNVDVVVDPVRTDEGIELRASMRIINRATPDLPEYVLGLWERNGGEQAGGYIGRVVVFAPAATTRIEFPADMPFEAYGRDGPLGMAAVAVYVPPGTDRNFEFTVFLDDEVLADAGVSEITVLPSGRVPNVAWRWGDTTFQDQQPRPMPLPAP
ncbi:MAG: DUF4012 domain-containing protein [Acidimicrobiales bacterium]